MRSPPDEDVEQDVDAVVDQERERRKVTVCGECRVVEAGRGLRALRVLAVAQRSGVLDREGNVGDIRGRLRGEAAVKVFDAVARVGLWHRKDAA